VPIKAPLDDPTGAAVRIAFVPEKVGKPDSNTTWRDATWKVDSKSYWPRTLVGPGSADGALALGDHIVWLRIAASPENVVLRGGTVELV